MSQKSLNQNDVSEEVQGLKEGFLSSSLTPTGREGRNAEKSLYPQRRVTNEHNKHSNFTWLRRSQCWTQPLPAAKSDSRYPGPCAAQSCWSPARGLSHHFPVPASCSLLVDAYSPAERFKETSYRHMKTRGKWQFLRANPQNSLESYGNCGRCSWSSWATNQ